MSAAAAEPTAGPGLAAPAFPLPRWLPWALLGLLVLPFHPYWLDFEQVRRALLLGLAGVVWLAWPRLPAVRGERAAWVFLAALAVCALISVRSLQPWEAAYRLGHWVALVAVLRLGAAAAPAFATPLATVLLVTSAFGVLQRFGIAAVLGYGVEREPVSVFGNLNVAAEWTAVAAMAVAVLGTSRVWLQPLALFAAGTYAVVDGSRSALIALPIGLFLLTLLRRREVRGFVPLLVCLAGGLLGYVIDRAAARPTPTDPVVVEAEHRRSSATVEVRWEIARSCTTLFAERPLFGFGPGQFVVQYPRVRSQREIELSSHDRQFATEVRTAHDDWLELLVEGGLPILFVFAAMLFALQRSTRDKARLLPLFVLLLLMFARSPLYNAPAVVAALLLVGSTATGAVAPGPGRTWATRAGGLVLLGLGTLVLVAHQLFTPYQAATAQGQQPPRSALQAAHAWMWWEPRFLQLLAQEQLLAGDLPAARRSAARANLLRPHDPQLQLLVGEVLARGGAYDKAEALAKDALQRDPAHPELRVLLSVSKLQRGDVDGAVTAVLDNPHPRLRERLPRHFADLEKLAKQAGNGPAMSRCAFERSVLDVLETIGDPAPGALDATTAKLRTLAAATKSAGRGKADLRPYLLYALHYQALGETAEVAAMAKTAAATQAKLLAWQQAQFGEHLGELRRNGDWAALLR